jgi:hypothetical protein
VIFEQNSPTIKFGGEYKVALVDCFLKNTNGIPRKGHIYDAKIRPCDWPLVRNQHIIKKINSFEYPFVILPYEELSYTNDLCRAINETVSALKKGAFQVTYSNEEVKIYISSRIANKKIILNDNVKDVLGFYHNIINRKSDVSTSVIFADYPPAFSSDTCIFLYASFVETSRVGNSNIPLLRVLERKTSQDHIHHYNIKHLHHIPGNTSYLELCQLTLRSELGDSIAITNGLTVITYHF